MIYWLLTKQIEEKQGSPEQLDARELERLIPMKMKHEDSMQSKQEGCNAKQTRRMYLERIVQKQIGCDDM